ncbi:MAG: hypothetical protein ACN4EU_02570 [Brevundimonas mediterranea]
MARAQFQKGQKVWVECVGAWATIEKVQPVWAKGFDEPVRVTYDVGLGREFAAAELMMAAADAAGAEVGDWRVLRARNKWQAEEDCLHHPQPGTYPVVVTDTADWGGWRMPGAEYDRDPQRIEFQSRLIAAAPRLMQLAESLMDLVAESPDDAPPAVLALARQARDTLQPVTEILEAAPARASGVMPGADASLAER